MTNTLPSTRQRPTRNATFRAVSTTIFWWFLFCSCHDTHGLALGIIGQPALKLRRLIFRSNHPNTTPPSRRMTHGSTVTTPLVQGVYVPDGLTLEQYQQIKLQESQELAQKDFGAFGPKFQKDPASARQGDWFLQPQLWTRGMPQQRPSKGGDDREMPPPQPFTRRGLVVQRILPLFLWTLLLVEVSTSSFGMVTSSLRSPTKSSWKLLVRAWYQQSWVEASTPWVVAKVISALVGTPLLARVCRGMQNQWQCKWRWTCCLAMLLAGGAAPLVSVLVAI